MNITKAARLATAGTPTAQQLALVNRYAKSALTQDEVYVFSLRLCDDRVDRDFERFSPETIEKMAPMFLGKTGIADHEWSAGKQLARIFDTRVARDDEGCYLEAWAYMLRNEKNAPVIEEIEAGIRKEVSVGCAMGRATCSICGGSYGVCAHRKGTRYDGETCVKILSDPTDCYEFSFVAVPAQPAAGVLKAWKGGRNVTLQELVQKSGNGAAQTALGELERLAALGRQYRAGMEQDVVRLGLSIDFGASEESLKHLAARLHDAELDTLRKELQAKADTLYPPIPQMTQAACAGGMENEFMI